MKKFILLFGLVFSAGAYGADTCKQNPIYCKILKHKKNADKQWAMEFSNKLTKQAKENGIDPNIALAILLQESMLTNVNTYHKEETVEEKKCDAKGCYVIKSKVKKAFDMSIAQINTGTAINYQFDLDRLHSLDQDYALECFFVILKDKINICSGLRRPWSCYHSTTEIYRLVYAEFVERYL